MNDDLQYDYSSNQLLCYSWHEYLTNQNQNRQIIKPFCCTGRRFVQVPGHLIVRHLPFKRIRNSFKLLIKDLTSLGPLKEDPILESYFESISFLSLRDHKRVGKIYLKFKFGSNIFLLKRCAFPEKVELFLSHVAIDL